MSVNPAVHEDVRSVGDDFAQVPSLTARPQPTRERQQQLVNSIFAQRAPHRFIDPFSNEIFADPVLAEDGHNCA